MKILIVRLSSIGDVVHTLPVLSVIRKELPDAAVSWVVEKSSAEILRGNPLLENLIEIDTRSFRGGKIIEEMLLEASRQIGILRRYDFDVALDFQGLLKSALVAKCTKTPRRCGFDKENLREPMSRFLLTETFSVPQKVHVIRKNLFLIERALKIKVPDKDFEFPIFTDDEHRREAEKIISEAGDKFAILNPAGGWVTKLWAAEKFGHLADKLWKKNGLVSVVTTAPGEVDLAQKVLNNSRTGKTLAVEISLKGFYELARKAQIYIGGDTGPTHLAIAAGCSTVGIFGPTEWWRNGSTNPRDICVERTDISCRTDCHRRTCDNWICMDISVDTVFEAVQKRLESKT